MKNIAKAVGGAIVLLAIGVGGSMWLRGAPPTKPEHDSQPTPLGRPTSSGVVGSAPAGEPSIESHPRVPVDPDEAVPGAPGTAPFAGTLVDASTGEPVPFHSIEVTQSDRVEILATDSLGAFIGEVEFSPGRLDLRFRDTSNSDRKRREEFRRPARESVIFDPAVAARDRIVGVSVGPTIFFDLNLPPEIEVGQLHAALLAPTLPFLTSYLRDMTATALRAGAIPWVRFPYIKDRPSFASDGPFTVQVYTPDGLWSGLASIDFVEGVYPDRVFVDVTARSRISGLLVDSDGVAIAGATVQLEPIASGGADLAFRGWLQSGDDGAFDFPFASPGVYVLSALSPRHERFRENVEVHEGDSTESEIRLAELRSAGMVRGRLTSESGRYRTDVLVMLSDPSDEGFQMSVGSEWVQSDDGFEAPFSIEDVPAGEYVLSVFPFGDARTWQPLQLAVRPPASGLELVCMDGAPAADLGFKVLDARTRDALSGLAIAFQLGSRSGKLGGMESGSAHLRNVSDDEVVAWAVSVRGFETAFGDRNDFTARGEDGVLLAEVVLRPGWSSRLRVISGENDQPVAGAEVLVDGVVVARTDAAGVAQVFASGVPADVEVRATGYRLRDRSALEWNADPVMDVELWRDVRMVSTP